MAQAKKHSKPKKRPAKRGAAKVPKRTTAPVRSNTLDPILLAIEDYKVAYAENNRTLAVSAVLNPRDNSPAKRKAEAASDRTCGRKDDALYRMVTTKATTLAGLEALARFLGERASQVEPCRWGDTVEVNARSTPKIFFATLAAALHDIADRTEARVAS